VKESAAPAPNQADAPPLDANFQPPPSERFAAALLAMVLIIATAGLVYELCMAAVASYLLGDSVRQFSLIIGVYLSALGLGAYLSRFVGKDVARVFVDVEIGAALIGGFSAPGLFLAFAFSNAFGFLLYSTVIIVGTLVGLELPLLIRVLERHIRFKDLIAKSLTFDYAGALLGSLGFTLLLVPNVGLVKSSLLCGVLNAGVALLSTWVLPRLSRTSHSAFVGARIRSALALFALLASLPFADRVLETSETAVYGAPILHAEQSEYQRIVVTRRATRAETDSGDPARANDDSSGAREHFELFLNGNLQFSSLDEAAYHEALVHPAMLATPGARHVLIGGGGDGLAAREVLKWKGVERVVLVDLDPAMTELARNYAPLRELNRASLHDPRLQIVHQDAMLYFQEAPHGPLFDVVILDFPDPSSYAIGKLYSERFYRRVLRHLAPEATLVVQASSPLLARKTYWCTVTTLESVGLHALPYHALVPSFGEWGFVLARQTPLKRDLEAAFTAHGSSVQTSFLTHQRLQSMFDFASDMARVPTESNRLNTQRLVSYYLDEWSRFN
jgi:spermidine synthase